MRIRCSKRKDQRDVFENEKVMRVLNAWDIQSQKNFGEELEVSYLCKSRNDSGAYLALTVRSFSGMGYDTFLYDTENEMDGTTLFDYRRQMWVLGGSYTLEEERENIKKYRDRILDEVRRVGYIDLGR